MTATDTVDDPVTTPAADPIPTPPAPPADTTEAPSPQTPPVPPSELTQPSLLSTHGKPHVAMACLMGAAAAAELASKATGQPGTVAVAAAIVLFVGAVLLALIHKTRLGIKRLAADFGKGWLWTVASATAAWLLGTIITGSGVSWESTGLLAAGGLALSQRWFAHHRISNTAGTEPVLPVVAPPVTRETLDRIPARWRQYIACPGGRLAGAELLDPVRLSAGTQYTVQFKPASHTFTDLVSALPKIAAGFRCGVSDLIPEANSADASQAKLTVLTNSPLKARTVFTEPIYPGDGLLGLGLWGDGSGYASWRLYSEDSMWGGVIIGGTGSGKSVMLSNLAVSAQMRGDTVVWFADGQDGASSPEMVDRVDWSVSKVRAALMLRAAYSVAVWRSRQNRKYKWGGFTPAPERPGLLIIIDECHLVFEDQESCKLAEDIARIGRKVGVAIVCASQYAGIRTFGGSKALRISIMQGNAVAMYTANKGERSFFPNLDLDPSMLPRDKPGYAYLIDVVGSGKSAPFRGRDFARKPKNTTDKTVLKHSLTWWWDQCPDTVPDNVIVGAADYGTDNNYSNRHAESKEEVEKWAAAVAAMESGDHEAVARLVKAAKETKKTPTGQATSHPAHTGKPDRPRGLLARVPMVHLRDFGRKRTPAPAGPVVPPGLTEAQAAVWRAVAQRPNKIGRLADLTGFSQTWVKQQLDELIAMGLVEQPVKYKEFQLTTKTRTAA